MWMQSDVVGERTRFVNAVRSGDESFSDVCARFGVSRKTGYKWMARADANGSLEDASRRPRNSPRRLDDELAELFVQLRHARPKWGARKLLARLQRLHGDAYDWPSASTVGQLLKQRNLLHKRRSKPKLDAYVSPLSPMDEPNAVWCADFKGDFKTGDRRRVLPLTLTDGASRYILRCIAVARGDLEHVKPVFESAFREFGLPRVIRTDNGPPFVSIGPGGLSKLSVWFFKLGIHHERTKPGKPTQNARHERMHRTLAEDTASPPAKSLREQQRRFDSFCRIFNEERPHEGLGMKTPSDVYYDSPRPFPRKIEQPTYPAHHQLRVVRPDGAIQFGGHYIFVSEALAKETIGLEERDDGTLGLYFSTRSLGVIDRSTLKFDKSRRDE